MKYSRLIIISTVKRLYRKESGSTLLIFFKERKKNETPQKWTVWFYTEGNKDYFILE